MLYFWLNEAVKKQIKKREKEYGVGKKEFEYLGDTRVETHESSGKKYIDANCNNPIDPTFVFPDIPREFIETITFKNHIEVNFRTEGVYLHDGAVLLLETHSWVERSDTDLFEVKRQDVSISALNLEALKAIYSLVRQGKIEPIENWEDEPLKKKLAINLNL